MDFFPQISGYHVNPSQKGGHQVTLKMMSSPVAPPILGYHVNPFSERRSSPDHENDVDFLRVSCQALTFQRRQSEASLQLPEEAGIRDLDSGPGGPGGGGGRVHRGKRDLFFDLMEDPDPELLDPPQLWGWGSQNLAV